MLVIVALLATQAPPLAPEPPAAIAATRLIYVPGVLAAQCPSQADVQARVVQNLGADPFTEPATQFAMLVVELDGDKPARARAELLDVGYTSMGERVIEGHGDNCEELVAAAALALAIALDPTRALAPPTEPLPPTPVSLEPARAPLPRVIVRDDAPNSDPIRNALPEGMNLTLGVGGQGGLLLTPGFQRGAHVTAALRGSWWGLGAELRNDVPAFDPTGATLLSFVPCAHLGVIALRDDDDRLGVRLCATSTAGLAWSLASNIGGGPYLGLGARAGVEWAMKDGSAVGMWVQAEFAAWRPIYIDAVTQLPQQSAPVNIAFGATFDLGWPL